MFWLVTDSMASSISISQKSTAMVRPGKGKALAPRRKWSCGRSPCAGLGCRSLCRRRTRTADRRKCIRDRHSAGRGQCCAGAPCSSSGSCGQVPRLAVFVCDSGPGDDDFLDHRMGLRHGGMRKRRESHQGGNRRESFASVHSVVHVAEQPHVRLPAEGMLSRQCV